MPIAPSKELPELEGGDGGRRVLSDIAAAVCLDAPTLRDLEVMTCDCNSLLALFQRLQTNRKKIPNKDRTI